MSGLKEEQIKFFKEEGYLIVEDVLPPTDLQPLIEEFNEAVNLNAREAESRGWLKEIFEKEPFERRLAKICDSADDPALGSIQSILFRGLHAKVKTAGMFAVITHSAILDIVESLIGPEILAHPQFNVRAKLPNQDRSVVPWHQDLGYLQLSAENTFMVNFWIPLVNATVENGCMEVIAGSHRSKILDHVPNLGPAGNFKGVIDEELPKGKQISCPMRVGDVLLMHHTTIHRSIPNNSDHIRWSLDLRYCDPSLPTGRDHDHPGFIARSLKHPELVAKSHLNWLRDFIELMLPDMNHTDHSGCCTHINHRYSPSQKLP